MAVTGSTAAAAAFLAACGGSGDNGSSSGSSARGGLVSTPADTTKQAKAGGTWVLPHPEDPPNIDPLTTTFFGTNFQPHFSYSRPVKYKAGNVNSPPTGEIEGDFFQSWELSGDKMQVTFKMRPGIKFDPQPPVNGRAVTMDDVNWSWNQLISKHVSKASFSNALNPDAPIVSMTTPDASTVVFKLARPYVPILSLFGVNRGLVIQPTEAESKFDPRSEMHGTGPWMLTKYTPSVSLEYKKNPNYYDAATRPFIENISRPIIKEYAQSLAQFEAGTVATLGPFSAGTPELRPEDTIPVKKRQPKMLMLATGYDDSYPTMMQFDWRPTSPYKDARIRQAMSMLVDRDLWIETFNNVAAYKAEGIDVNTRWNSHFAAGDPRYWMDPQDSKSGLGEGAKYFQFNPKDALALLKAAGKEGMEFKFQYQSPSSSTQRIEAFSQMLQQNGNLKPTLTPLDRNTWTSTCHVGGGLWDGICADLAAGAGVDIDVWLDTRVRYKATQYVPYAEPLPIIDDLCKAQKQEFDNDKRTAMVKQIEMEMAKQMVAIPYPGITERFQLTWPWLSNFGFVQSVTGGYVAAESYVHYWIDDSKRA